MASDWFPEVVWAVSADPPAIIPTHSAAQFKARPARTFGGVPIWPKPSICLALLVEFEQDLPLPGDGRGLLGGRLDVGKWVNPGRSPSEGHPGGSARRFRGTAEEPPGIERCAHPVAEPEPFDGPRARDHQPRVDLDRLAGQGAVEQEPAARAQRSEDSGSRLTADRVDRVLHALAAGDRRTCSSIGPSAEEITASPPSSLSSSMASRRRTTLSVLKPSCRPR